MKRIGIDVGGTNTDAVLIADEKVVHSVKCPTTADVTSGILDALRTLRANSAAAVPVDAVVIGTTHFVNAVVQRRHLQKIAAIRIGRCSFSISDRCLTLSLLECPIWAEASPGHAAIPLNGLRRSWVRVPAAPTLSIWSDART